MAEQLSSIKQQLCGQEPPYVACNYICTSLRPRGASRLVALPSCLLQPLLPTDRHTLAATFLYHTFLSFPLSSTLSSSSERCSLRSQVQVASSGASSFLGHVGSKIGFLYPALQSPFATAYREHLKHCPPVSDLFHEVIPTKFRLHQIHPFTSNIERIAFRDQKRSQIQFQELYTYFTSQNTLKTGDIELFFTKAGE